jgi:hypothetical protein
MQLEQAHADRREIFGTTGGTDTNRDQKRRGGRKAKPKPAAVVKPKALTPGQQIKSQSSGGNVSSME